jgi:uncharacterized protein
MRNNRLWFFAGFMLALDIYIFQVIRFLSAGAAPKTKMILFAAYWLISISAIVMTLLLPQIYYTAKNKTPLTYVFAIIIGLFIFKLLSAAFFLVDDLRRLLQWVFQKATHTGPVAGGEGVTRSVFLSWLGFAVGGGIFTSLIYGFGNKYNYKIRRAKLSFPNLPAGLRGLKIVQLSDIHSGSFNNPQAVAKGVEKVLKEQPDLILFTGDLVNNIATEMEPYKEIFARLKAPLGVYSVLGNHDYGDYYPWPDRDDAHDAREIAAGRRLQSPQQQKNLQALMQLQADMGWRLLMNEHVVLEKEGHQFALLGIENWSARGNFPKYGKLHEAHQGSEHIPFKILMSHDPSHWDAEVRTQYPDIQLTLSGHTHGMQFGVEIPGFRWSPVQYVYKQWAGLYEQQPQQLYINRGFGFIGYPGRVGILPEITVLELNA